MAGLKIGTPKKSDAKNHRTLDALAWALIQRLGRSASLEASADGKAPKHPSEISPGPQFFFTEF
jgi:hypothetical protein